MAVHVSKKKKKMEAKTVYSLLYTVCYVSDKIRQVR